MATPAETTEIYNAVLQRDPSTEELDAFVAQSEDEGDDAAIARLVRSPDAQANVYPFLRVYQAIFGRVPDEAGLNFWVDNFRGDENDDDDTGTLSLRDIVQGVDSDGDGEFEVAGFRNSPEFIAEYGADVDPNSEEFITALYQNLLGRAPDAEGLEFFTNLPDDATVGDVVTAFTQSPEFGGQINSEIRVFLTNAAEGDQDYLGSIYDVDDDGDVDDDDANDIDGDGTPDNEDDDDDNDGTPDDQDDDDDDDGIDDGDDTDTGDIFTLTDDDDADEQGDDVTGTEGDDLIRGGTGTVDEADVIDGNGGNDTLRAGFDVGEAPVIRDVETVINTDQGNFDAEFVTGAQQIWEDNAGGNGVFNARLGVTYGSMAGGAYNIRFDDQDFSGEANAVSLAVMNNETLATFNLRGADQELLDSVETVNIASLGDANDGTADDGTDDADNDDLVEIGNVEGLETVVVTGSGDINVTVESDALESFNSSTATGDVTADLTTTNDDEDDNDFVLRVNTGAGDDVVTITSAGDALIVSGAGEDDLTGGDGSDVFGSGLGEDLLTGGDGNDEFHYAVSTLATADADVVLDFEAGASAAEQTALETALTAQDTPGGDPVAEQAAVDAAQATVDDAVQDVVSFLEGGPITFENTEADGTRAVTLDEADYVTFANFASTQGEDVANKVVEIEGDFTVDQINSSIGAEAEFYLVANATDADDGAGGNASGATVWYDDDWSDADGRVLVTTLTGVDTEVLDNADFSVYS